MVRLADEHDATAIARLRRAWAEENAAGPIADDTFEERFAAWFERESQQRLTWLAYADGQDGPVGC